MSETVKAVQGWAVDVSVNGDTVLTIGHNHLSGIENISDYAEVVANCGRHLLSFIGEPEALARPSPQGQGEVLRQAVGDETWKRALDCAASKFESYYQGDALSDKDQRRVAIDDALQHAVGIIQMSAAPSPAPQPAAGEDALAAAPPASQPERRFNRVDGWHNAAPLAPSETVQGSEAAQRRWPEDTPEHRAFRLAFLHGVALGESQGAAEIDAAEARVRVLEDALREVKAMTPSHYAREHAIIDAALTENVLQARGFNPDGDNELRVGQTAVDCGFQHHAPPPRSEQRQGPASLVWVPLTPSEEIIDLLTTIVRSGLVARENVIFHWQELLAVAALTDSGAPPQAGGRDHVALNLRSVADWEEKQGNTELAGVVRAAAGYIDGLRAALSRAHDALRCSRRVAFLHFHAEDRDDNPQLLARECQRLYDALTKLDGEEPDLTFCCGCREEIEIDNGQEQWVLYGAKYHERCYAEAKAALDEAKGGKGD